MNEIKVNLENLTENEREQILTLIDKANKPKVWKPKEDEKYFFINFIGDIEAVNWCACSFDEKLYTLGNCFKTQKETEWKLEHQKVKTELQRFAEGFNEPIHWGDSKQEKYKLVYITYPSEQGIKAEFVNNFVRCADTVYFTSEEIAKQAIETIGEERLKKYYFGVGK